MLNIHQLQFVPSTPNIEVTETFNYISDDDPCLNFPQSSPFISIFTLQSILYT